jgi:hypothetical protein
MKMNSAKLKQYATRYESAYTKQFNINKWYKVIKNNIISRMIYLN